MRSQSNVNSRTTGVEVHHGRLGMGIRRHNEDGDLRRGVFYLGSGGVECRLVARKTRGASTASRYALRGQGNLFPNRLGRAAEPNAGRKPTCTRGA